MNVRWNSWVARAVSIGRAMARFFGTSSPKIMVRNVLRVRAIVDRDRVDQAVGHARPTSSGPSISSAIAGSAR